MAIDPLLGARLLAKPHMDISRRNCPEWFQAQLSMSPSSQPPWDPKTPNEGIHRINDIEITDMIQGRFLGEGVLD